MTIKNWKDMSTDEKSNSVGKIAQLRGAGFSWDEIGEFYNVSSKSIRDYYDDHKPRKSAEIAEAIITGSDKVEITLDTISPLLGQLLERIESLELEVASVKKLQVENAAIERLDDTEYKFFVKNRKTNEEFKFRDAIELAKFVSEFKGCKFRDKFFVDSTGILKPNASDIYPLLITQCFKNDNDNMSRELETWKIEGKLLQNELENIKSNL